MKNLIPIATATMLLLFIVATSLFLHRNTFFWLDDFDHFRDAMNLPLLEMLKKPIDVHFAPLHQLSSYLLFNATKLDFSSAEILMVTLWVSFLGLIYRLLRKFLTVTSASIATLLVGANPVWIHTLAWWSASAHRLPYLLLQVAALLAYRRYREKEKTMDAAICVSTQLLALGFFVKGILFPLVLVAFEICLANRSRKVSHAGAKLCGLMAVISALYVCWYITLSHIAHPEVGIGFDVLRNTMGILSRFGSALLFLPPEPSWTGWVAGAFWLTLAGVWISTRPGSALPISAIFLLSLANFLPSVIGRGWLITFPFSAARYYSEVVVIVALFGALAFISPRIAAPQEKNTPSNLKLFFVLALSLSYSVAAYFSNQYVFYKAYKNLELTHDFMVHAQRSLNNLSLNSGPVKVLNTDLPRFAYGMLGVPMTLNEVFGIIFPNIEWVDPGQRQVGIYWIRDDGRIEPVAVPGPVR